MAVSDLQVVASHLEGGNYFDDMRIDISESHHRFDHLPRALKSIRQPRYRNLVKLFFITSHFI